ncbi:MAG: tyrosine-type recombinase/integrase [Erythrobacter sp.]
MEKPHIDDLRHTFASHAAMSEETLPLIGRLLGHANRQSTACYAHLDDEHLLDAAQQVGVEVKRLMGAQMKYRLESDFSEHMPRAVLDTDVIVTALGSATGAAMQFCARLHIGG